ncbi:MAG TPA: hypothetical protein P5080_04800 [Candidatus Paceibacterota bacterium]|nr:hypothetical protein [Candidatus Pacearchaeota archaeon]HRZ51270.1 hypothetical protein [Candidatus Paceibacterota bacterium]HSA36992.1 hypothetical protein [Candidatus Paceibacterota bacterium]
MLNEGNRANKENHLEGCLNVYTNLNLAKDEIWQRWNNRILREKVNRYLNGDIPPFLTDGPKAYLAAHVASPNYGFLEYLKASKEMNLLCAIPEYRKDKYVSKNECKYYIARLFLYGGKGKKGGQKIETKTIIDISGSEGKKFSEIKTVWNEDFIGFHHKLLNLLCPGLLANICDFSDWIIRNGGRPVEFYEKFLSLFVCNAVLFENFLIGNREERVFFREVVIPSFKRVQNIFGVKPLIVPTVPLESQNDLYWQYYPRKIATAFKNSQI